MLYLFRLLIILGISTFNLNSTELIELKNNFYININKFKLNSFETNANKESFAQDDYFYGVGYLRQLDNFYLGASLKISPNDILKYSVISEDNKNIDISRTRDFLVSLDLRYNFFEFENIKLLLGIDFGYQFNSFNLNYVATKFERIKEEQKIELGIGEIIDESLRNKCNVGIIGDNIILDPNTGEYIVTGENVYCYSSAEVEKQVEYNQNTELMKASMPISLSFVMFYGLTANVDLGVGLGITMIENLSINYSDNFIKLNNKQSLSYYNLYFLINYKIGDKKRY
jgi:hypothetical protein